MNDDPGRIVILNGPPRSGKSSIVHAMQTAADELWINLGVDVSVLAMTPEKYRPGIGLRPGGERPDLEDMIVRLYAALYDSITAHGRQGLNVIAEFSHHESYSRPLGILPECARRLAGLPVLLVGVHCPLEEIMRRRRAGQPGRDTSYLTANAEEPVPAPVRLFQSEVHKPGIYDMEVDTGTDSAEVIAAGILERLAAGPPGTAFATLAGM